MQQTWRTSLDRPAPKARFRLEALQEGWVAISRPWHLLTTNTGAGDPHAATAEKGRQLMDLIVERLNKSGGMRELIYGVVESAPFQKRRGDGSRLGR